MNLKIPAYAAIVMAITTIPFYTIAFLKGFFSESQTLYILYIAVIVIGFLLSLPIVIGYIRIAKKNKAKFLEVMMYIGVAVGLIIGAHSIITNLSQPLIGLILSVFSGLLIAISGVAVLELKKKFGTIIIVLGILYIVQGVFLMTIILSLLSPFLSLAINILEAIFFFRASKMYD